MVRQGQRRGFTALELLVVMIVIAFFLCMGFLSQSRRCDHGRRNTCSSNIRQLALAMHNFESTNRRFPAQNLFAKKTPGNVTVTNIPGETAGGVETEASYSFITQLLPQIEERNMFKNIDFELNPFEDTNGKYCGTPIPVLQCPCYRGKRETIGSDYTAYTSADWKAPRKPMLTQYVAMGATTRDNLYRTSGATTAEPDGFIFSTVKPIRDGIIADGMAKTIMLCETREDKYAVWMDGTTASVFGITADGKTTLNRVSPYIASSDFGGSEDWLLGPSSMHRGMTHHAFGDGAVRPIYNNIDPEVYRALITRASKVLNGGSDADQVESFFN